MKAKWWTCGCGKAQVYRGYGTPTCEDCGKLATFTVEPPKGQGGFDFGSQEKEGMVMLCGYHGELYDELYAEWHRLERVTLADGARRWDR
jgi:hypothetical protein